MAAEVRRALPLDRLGDGPRRRGHGDVGRGGRLLLRRAAAARRPRHAAQGPVDGRAAAALRRHRHRRRARRAVPRARRAVRVVRRRRCRSCCATIHDPRRPGVAGARLVASSTRASCAGSWRRMLDEDEFLGPLRDPLAVALPRRAPVRRSGSAARSTGSPTSRPSPTPGCSAATPTGAARSGSGQRACSSGRCCNYYLYYGDGFTVECPTGSGRRMNLYEVAEEISRRLDRHLPARRRTAAARSSAATSRSRTTRTGATAAVLRVLPRRQRRRPRGQPPDRLDRARRPLPAPVRRSAAWERRGRQPVAPPLDVPLTTWGRGHEHLAQAAEHGCRVLPGTAGARPSGPSSRPAWCGVPDSSCSPSSRWVRSAGSC